MFRSTRDEQPPKYIELAFSEQLKASKAVNT